MKKKKKKRRLKKKPFIILFIIIFSIVFSIFKVKSIIDTINYHKTYEYKFISLGYTKDEFKDINKLTDESKEYLISIGYDDELIRILNEKYFIEKNLSKYLDYRKISNKPNKDIIAIINVGADNEWYTNVKDADQSKDNLLLVNKFYKLSSSYNSDNMVNINNTYCYGENQKLTKEAYDAFIDMFESAKKENLTLIINSSFRSYDEQKEVYDYYEDSKGEEYANKYAAKPGHSEHQTGMAIDIQTYGSTANTFEEFDEFKWLQENAYKYGFILRYPKDKEYITGYEYESWHYRYVGKEAAKYIYENNITFDEYYAYFIEKD